MILDAQAAKLLTHGKDWMYGILAAAVRPKERITVSQWANRNLWLTSKGSSEPGLYRVERTPYMREIMDNMTWHSPVREVTLMKCNQSGGTQGPVIGSIGYYMTHKPVPIAVYNPTVDKAEEFEAQKLKPLLTDSPLVREAIGELKSRDSANRKDLKDFPGGILYLNGGNSPNDYAMKSLAVAIMDDADRFPREIGSEGDVVDLLRARLKTFQWKSKFLKISTPTLQDTSIIWEEFQKSDQRYWHMPCPHCGEDIRLLWENLAYDPKTKAAHYICQECGCFIHDDQKPGMLAKGRWIPSKPEIKEHRGYHVDDLMLAVGLGHSWAELGQMWLDAQGDEGKLKAFYNLHMGMPYRSKRSDFDPSAIKDRGELYPLRLAPPGCLRLTAGVDVQDNRLAVQILGWGRNRTQYPGIDWVELYGDPNQDDVWLELTDLLNRPILNCEGQPLSIDATAIDSGGHCTKAVYNYVRMGLIRRPMAIKGSLTPNAHILGKPKEIDFDFRGRSYRASVKLWAVGGHRSKSDFFEQLGSDTGQPAEARKLRFSAELPAEFFAQLLAPKWEPGKGVWITKKGQRDEASDTYHYANAAGHHPELRLHLMREADWDARAKQLDRLSPAKPPQELPAAPIPQPDPAALQAPARRRIEIQRFPQ